MQKSAKKLISAILGWQVRRLSRKNNFKVIAVAGSIGKTSTKLTVAHVLQAKYRVQFQHGNYNDLISVPLIYFGHDFEEQDRLPILYNPLSWLKIFIQNELIIRRHYPYDVVVVELGPDGPGQMEPFKKFVKADIGVLTAITAEHMAFFGDMDSVAREEMVLAQLSEKLLYNSGLVSEEYLKLADIPKKGYLLKQAEGLGLRFASKPQTYSASAAVLVGKEFGLSNDEIKQALESVKPHAGRMQWLRGIRHSTIIDDSYNASPEAMKNALDALYATDSNQKIAVLGNMNELGSHSPEAHKQIGAYCDPKRVDLVITLGPDANKYLAPAAEAKGCEVKTFDDPYTLGEYLKTVIHDGAIVLVKGSQNKVYAEEAIKPILDSHDDAQKLVRQSAKWLKIKKANFSLK